MLRCNDTIHYFLQGMQYLIRELRESSIQRWNQFDTYLVSIFHAAEAAKYPTEVA